MVTEMFNILGFITESSLKHKNKNKSDQVEIENCDNAQVLTEKEIDIILRSEEEKDKTQQFERLLPSIQYEK